MKRVSTLLLRAFAGALLLQAIVTGTASADPGPAAPAAGGPSQILTLPQDPGLE